MSLTITWPQVALRLLLAAAASFFIGFNRDEKGHPAGVRTTMLVCLAATLAMLQVNLLLPLSGKTPSSFAVMDLMRNPLGILTGMGFLGAGVIIKRDRNLVTGVTTAATLWFVTVLGLLFGAGNLGIGSVGSLLAILILWGLKKMENFIPRRQHGSLTLSLDRDAPSEEELRQYVFETGCRIVAWSTRYAPAPLLTEVKCELAWRERADRQPHTPAGILKLRTLPGVRFVSWSE
jgi:putative Mg2+ transporter-C (MgtC) family protein